MCKRFTRKLEKSYSHSPYIFEFWNTISNSPFIIFGLAHLVQGTEIPYLYFLLTMCGVCSGIHHCINFRYSIVLDYIPIVFSVMEVVRIGAILTVTPVTVCKLILALSALLTDHVYTPILPPFGHVIWHLTAAFAAEGVYSDYENYTQRNLF